MAGPYMTTHQADTLRQAAKGVEEFSEDMALGKPTALWLNCDTAEPYGILCAVWISYGNKMHKIMHIDPDGHVMDFQQEYMEVI